MPLTNQQIVKNYRERQKNLLGDAEYKRIQREKKREYRASKRAPIADVDGCDTLLNTIFEKKQKALAKKDKIISLESFKKNTWGNLNKIFRKMNNEDWDCNDTAWLRNADEIIKFIKDIYPIQNTVITNISSFASVTAVLGPSFKSAYKKYSEISSNDRRAKDAVDNKNQSTNSEKDKMVSMNILKDLWKHPDLTDRERAIISLYTMIPPRRNQFSQFLKLKKSEDDLPDKFNYLIVDKDGDPQKLVLKNYKTFKQYGIFNIPLTKTKKLNEILKKYIISANLKDGDLLFHNSKGGIQKNISNEIKKAFFKASGKNITVNIIRHIFISKFLEKRRTIEEKNKLARQMGHSRNVQESYMRIDAPTKTQAEIDDEIKAKFYE